MAIEIVSFPIENCDFPYFLVCLPEGNYDWTWYSYGPKQLFWNGFISWYIYIYNQLVIEVIILLTIASGPWLYPPMSKLMRCKILGYDEPNTMIHPPCAIVHTPSAPWCWYIRTYKTGWFCSGKCWCAYSGTMVRIWVQKVLVHMFDTHIWQSEHVLDSTTQTGDVPLASLKTLTRIALDG